VVSSCCWWAFGLALGFFGVFGGGVLVESGGVVGGRLGVGSLFGVF